MDVKMMALLGGGVVLAISLLFLLRRFRRRGEDETVEEIVPPQPAVTAPTRGGINWWTIAAVVVAIAAVYAFLLAPTQSGTVPADQPASTASTEVVQEVVQAVEITPTAAVAEEASPKPEEPVSETDPLWMLVIPPLLWVSLCLGLNQAWIQITKPQIVEGQRVEFSFEGGGSGSFELVPFLAMSTDPGALQRAQALGVREAQRQLLSTLVDQARGVAESHTVFERKAIPRWGTDVNRALALRAERQEYDKDPLLEIEAVERDTGWKVRRIRFSEIELDSTADQMLQEEGERQRRVENVSTEFAMFCYKNGLQASEANFRTWKDLIIEQQKAQADQVRAGAFSEFVSDLAVDEIVSLAFEFLRSRGAEKRSET